MKAKIKNAIPVILSLLLIFAIAVYSENAHSYRAYVIGSSLSASGTEYKAEKNIYEKEEKDEASAPKTATLSVNGYTLEATYSHSEKSFPDNYYKRIYLGRTPTHHLYFDSSGQLLSFHWTDMNKEIKAKVAKEHTREECLAIAKDFILNNVSDKIDFAEYSVEETRSFENRYAFRFRKYINGYATTDEATVTVLKNGFLFDFVSHMFGKISADDMPNLNREKIVRTAEKKLDVIYKDAKGKFAAVKYEEPDLLFVLLDDGSPAIRYRVSARFEDGTGGSFGESVSLLITL